MQKYFQLDVRLLHYCRTEQATSSPPPSGQIQLFYNWENIVLLSAFDML
jgi:hypothetical protein